MERIFFPEKHLQPSSYVGDEQLITVTRAQPGPRMMGVLSLPHQPEKTQTTTETMRRQ